MAEEYVLKEITEVPQIPVKGFYKSLVLKILGEFLNSRAKVVEVELQATSFEDPRKTRGLRDSLYNTAKLTKEFNGISVVTRKKRIFLIKK